MEELASQEVAEDSAVADARTSASLHRILGPAARPARSNGTVIRRYRRIGLALAASDAVCISVALVLSSLWALDRLRQPGWFPLVSVTAPIVWIAIFHAFGLYAPQHLSKAEMLRRIIGAASVGVLLVAMEGVWTETPLSPAWIGATWFIAMILELAVRRAWAWGLGRMRRDGSLSFRTLIVGADEDAVRLARALARPGSGFRPIGFVGLHEAPTAAESFPVLGRLDRLGSLIQGVGAECLFVGSAAMDAQGMRRVTHAARRAGLELRVSANLPQILTSRLTVQQMGRTSTLSLRPARSPDGRSRRRFPLL
jgi:FlaA1/EpsC-like NDP-sugar epimerase